MQVVISKVASGKSSSSISGGKCESGGESGEKCESNLWPHNHQVLVYFVDLFRQQPGNNANSLSWISLDQDLHLFSTR